jgi:hypothetical protein
MSTQQNLATLNLSPEEVAGMDAGLDQLDVATVRFVSLTPEQKLAMVKMGAKSEVFCRQTLSALELNPQVLSANVNLADAQSDLRAIDLLMPRLQRLTKLFQRFLDTDQALRSDVMALALIGYKLLKVTGRGASLEPLKQQLGMRFAKKRRVQEVPKTA